MLKNIKIPLSRLHELLDYELSSIPYPNFPDEFLIDGKIHHYRINQQDAKETRWYLAFINYESKSLATQDTLICILGTLNDKGNIASVEYCLTKNVHSVCQQNELCMHCGSTPSMLYLQ